jgi:2-phospho-L-lactate guanylyltransferase
MKQVWALVPLKDFASAKTRLASALSAEARRELALAMALDVATALVHSHAVARVIMVSDIPDLEQLMGIEGVEHFDTRSAQGLNEDLEVAAAWAGTQGATHVLIAHADLPRLTPRAIDRFILAAKDLPACRVRAAACKDGSGTNLLLAPLPLPLPLVFGRNSLARFCQTAAAAHVAIDVISDSSLAADVDEPGDFRALAVACTRGELTGSATARFLLSVIFAQADSRLRAAPPLQPAVWPASIWCGATRLAPTAIKKRAHG